MDWYRFCAKGKHNSKGEPHILIFCLVKFTHEQFHILLCVLDVVQPPIIFKIKISHSYSSCAIEVPNYNPLVEVKI
uniref:Uncharacterized protein LOC101492183 isoform X5 n=1 Tax=Cicer arietinum TaxID=3827 RepID=A0A1S3EIK0_CICAR|nr:uncharacterized protein LOC101492183 isoform X5 [Cicer arietinum]